MSLFDDDNSKMPIHRKRMRQLFYYLEHKFVGNIFLTKKNIYDVLRFRNLSIFRNILRFLKENIFTHKVLLVTIKQSSPVVFTA